MNRIPTFLAVAVALAAYTTSAREISSAEAGRAAAAWARRDAAPLGAPIASADVAEVRTASDSDGAPLFHAVRMAGGGVVVTSAESGVTPVVAFLDGDVPGEDNPIWDILKADMAERMEHVQAVRDGEGAVATQGTTRSRTSASDGARRLSTAVEAIPFAAAEAAWAELLDEPTRTSDAKRAASISDASSLSDLRVAPLISTTWDQDNNAANYYTPTNAPGDPDNYVCGCVALAGAEIANYWGFPTDSRSQVTNICYLVNEPYYFVSLGGTYDWANMPADFSSLSVVQKQAVGKLCYDFGVATKMNWGPLPEGSGTLGILLGEAFRDVFGYASAVAYSHFETNVMPADLVERTILASLDARSPVAIGLAGHTAVADGYGYASGTLYTHINLGWGGLGNAWYNLPEIEVSAAGYTSSILDSVVYNIHPTATGELLTGRVLDGNGAPVSNATVVAESGADTVTATTDARGIYALRVAGNRTWALSAKHGILCGSGSAYVGLSSSTVCTERTFDGGRVLPGEIGNSWGNDITISVATGDLYVDAANGSDANDGLSWESAKASIQAAIDIVEGNADTNAVILVNDGCYEPITATNDIPFQIISVNGPDATIIDGSLQWARGVTNRCATLGSETSHTNTVLSGFTLTNGHTPTNGVPSMDMSGGGSLYGHLVNCFLHGNEARYGGGARGGILDSCVVSNNNAVTGMGGGTYFSTLEDCTVADNSANYGGGLYNGSANRCTIAGNASSSSGGGADYSALTRCIVTNNTAGTSGGGAEGKTLKFCTVVGNSAGLSGGGAYNATLDDCTVSHNTAVNYGGGVYGTSYGGVANGCTIMLNTASNGAGSYGATLNSCILWNNTATGSGGGASNGTLNNCTIANNTAAQNGGGTYYATINNCIVWNNTAATRPAHYGAACRYSCLDDEPVAADDKGNNIVTNNPGFVDALHGDFHLLAGSPCIDAGTNEYATTETDFYGDARIVGERVDMGASEYQEQVGSTGYAAWAAQNGLGAADAVTDGQPNLIRYVFNRPSGAFSPFTGFTFQDGKPVVLFQSFNPDVSGVSLSILSTTNLLDWTHPVEFHLQGPPFNFNGIVLQHGDTAPARFYRLKVTE